MRKFDEILKGELEMMWMKRLVAATAAIAMLGALSGCGSKNDSSTADNGNGLSNNKFVVVLMLHFRRMAIRMTVGNMLALTWIWHRKSVTETVGNL